MPLVGSRVVARNYLVVLSPIIYARDKSHCTRMLRTKPYHRDYIRTLFLSLEHIFTSTSGTVHTTPTKTQTRYDARAFSAFGFFAQKHNVV